MQYLHPNKVFESDYIPMIFLFFRNLSDESGVPQLQYLSDMATPAIVREDQSSRRKKDIVPSSVPAKISNMAVEAAKR